MTSKPIIYWSNFIIPKVKTRKASVCQGTDELNRLQEFHDVDVSGYKGEQSKVKICRNLVDYQIGKYIYDIAKGIYSHNSREQGTLFD